MQYYIIMDNKIYFTRFNRGKEANEDEVKRFEKSAISDIGRGKQVYIIEKYPKKFFQLATRIRIEKVAETVASLSAISNARLFKVILTGSIYE